MDASIIVCTYNRCESLAETLEAIAAQQTPPGFLWELIVVDNNSKDRTQGTVTNFQNRYPELKVTIIFEVRQGLSHARNSGIEAAIGEFLVFTDDDVIPQPDWLFNLVDGMRRMSCLVAGGYIEPIWQSPPPKWLTERFHGFLAIKMDNEGPKRIQSGDETPFGANMAFHREAIRRAGLFNTELGRKGTQLAGGEETELMIRAMAAGCSIVYFPNARVGHKVEAFRLRKNYFRRWRYQGSYKLAANGQLPSAPCFWGVPRYLLPQLLRAVWGSLLTRLTRAPDEAFRQEMIIWHFLGLIAGARSHRQAATRE